MAEGNRPLAQVPIKKPRRIRQGRGFFIHPDQWPLLVSEYENGWTINDLSKRIGCSPQTLARKFREQGYKLRTRGRIRGKNYQVRTERITKAKEQALAVKLAKEAMNLILPVDFEGHVDGEDS